MHSASLTVDAVPAELPVCTGVGLAVLVAVADAVDDALVLAGLTFGPANLVQYPRSPWEPVRKLKKLGEEAAASWLQLCTILSKLEGL
jgi:hypothetical protein